MRSGRRPLLVGLSVVTALALVVGGVAVMLWWDRADRGQPSTTPSGEVGPPAAAGPGGQGPAVEVPAGARFVAGVSVDGRHFVDQHGDPVLVRGDSPWSLLVDLDPEAAELYLDNRQAHDVNAAIVSLVGATGNGGPSDDGATFDGLLPFEDGDVLAWDDAYWDRAHSTLAAAAQRGITVFLYPVDGWNVGHSLAFSSIDQCRAYGARVGSWAADLPNIVWMAGGDYFPVAEDPEQGSDVDRCFAEVVAGIRDTGDVRPFSIQLGYPRSTSTDNPFWATRVDFEFVYTYQPTFEAVRAAYDRSPPMPALFGEGNYEGENNDADTPATTNETLRRQAAWALTSGSPGDFYGSDDWEFLDGWETRLDSPGLRQVGVVRDVVEALPWADLRPEAGELLVRSGHQAGIDGDGAVDVLDADQVTAVATADGRYALAYVPTEQELGLDLDLLATGSVARWVDPSSGDEQPAELSSAIRTPGPNADGGADWLLVVEPS